MLIIKTNEKDLSYFQSIKKEYPENIMISRERGFDGSTTLQIFIDITEIVLENLLNAIGVFLTYKVAKKQEDLQKQELELHKREVEINEEAIDEKKFEIKIVSDSYNFSYSSDQLPSNADVSEVIKNVIEAIEKSSGYDN